MGVLDYKPADEKLKELLGENTFLEIGLGKDWLSKPNQKLEGKTPLEALQDPMLRKKLGEIISKVRRESVSKSIRRKFVTRKKMAEQKSNHHIMPTFTKNRVTEIEEKPVVPACRYSDSELERLLSQMDSVLSAANKILSELNILTRTLALREVSTQLQRKDFEEQVPKSALIKALLAGE